MIHDPALALHTIKTSQQEHRDIATSHRLVRTGSAEIGGDRGSARLVRAVRSARRLPRLRRPAAAPVGMPRPLSTP